MSYARPHATSSSTSLASALGWFSLALGVAELVAPGPLARLIGVRDSDANRNTLRVFGARELVAGAAILGQSERPVWLWSRVGGDALDLAWLSRNVADDETSRRRLGLAVSAVAGIAALDLFAARQLARRSRWSNGGVRIERVVTINRSADELYDYWRNFANLPRFMRHLESVEELGRRRSRWRAAAPAGMSVTWEAELLQDRKGEWLAWRSLPDSQVQNSGSVRFAAAPGGRGTEVRVQMEYMPPAGQVGRFVAMLFGEEPAQQVREDLRRFKQLMETGEVAISDGPGLWRAARPGTRARRAADVQGVSQ